jgi:uncharacterized membrane protein
MLRHLCLFDNHSQQSKEFIMMIRIKISSQQWAQQIWRQYARAIQKTASYYAMHMSVAVLVAWLVTGSWQMAIAISAIEPVVQSVAYFWHERWWAARGQSEKVAGACCPT